MTSTVENCNRLVSKRFKRWSWALFLVGGAVGTTLPGQLFLLASKVWARVKLRAAPVQDHPFRSPAPTEVVFLRLGRAFLVATLISAAFSKKPTMALAISAGFALLFFVVALGTKDVVGALGPEVPRRLVDWILIAGVVGALYGIYLVQVRGFSRAEGWSAGPNGFGGLCSLLAIFAIGASVEARKVSWRFVTIPVFLAAMAFSLSRGSWMGFIVSVIVFGVLLALSKRRGSRYVKWTALFLLIILVVTSALAASKPPIRNRAMSAFSLARNMDRILIWQTALEMIKDRPLTGVGGGVFPLVYHEYSVAGERRAEISFAHNLPLHILAEFGILGFIPFFAMIGLAVVRGWKVARVSSPLIMATYSGFIGTLAHELVDNIAIGMNFGGLFWFLIGYHVHLYGELHELRRGEALSPSETVTA